MPHDISNEELAAALAANIDEDGEDRSLAEWTAQMTPEERRQADDEELAPRSWPPRDSKDPDDVREHDERRQADDEEEFVPQSRPPKDKDPDVLADQAQVGVEEEPAPRSRPPRDLGHPDIVPEHEEAEMDEEETAQDKVDPEIRFEMQVG